MSNTNTPSTEEKQRNLVEAIMLMTGKKHIKVVDDTNANEHYSESDYKNPHTDTTEELTVE